MSKKLKYVAFIPARGGSKGILGKNIKVINGKPLIAWSIEQAKNCASIDDVFVSTDSMDIQNVAIRHGAKAPFLRPNDISGDTASTESSMLHFLDWADKEGIEIENIILMQATSPFRYENSISKAIEVFELEKADSLLTISKTHKFIWKKREDERLEANYDYFNRPRRQDIKKEDEIYFETGSFYITRKELFQRKRNRLVGKISSYEMTPEESFEIDDLIDFKLLDFLLKEYGI